jgi:amidohydrolase
VQAKVERVKGVPPVVNTTTGIEAFRLASLAGGMHPVPTSQSLGGEDFSWYLAHTDGAMARLGTRTHGGPTYDLHQGDLVVDEDAIMFGARLLSSVAVLRLREPGRRSPTALEAT